MDNDYGIPIDLIPRLVPTAETMPDGPGPPRLPADALPAPIGYVGFIDPKSAPEVAMEGVNHDERVELWVIDEPYTYKILKPGKYRLKPSLEQLRMLQPGKIVESVPDWKTDTIDEVIEEPRYFTFERYRITHPVTEEEAQWIMQRHPNVVRPDLSTWVLCPLHTVAQCPAVFKSSAARDDHIRTAHGG